MYSYKNQLGGFKKYLEPYQYVTTELDSLSSKSPSSQLADTIMSDTNEQATLINLTEGIKQIGGAHATYATIINPVSKLPVNILSDEGMGILANYLEAYGL